MNELLQYLYQPTGFTNHLLNITLAGLLMTIVIGFIALHTKRTMTKRFFFTWLSIGIILGTGAAYSTIAHKQEMSSLNKNDVTITRLANELIVEGKSHTLRQLHLQSKMNQTIMYMSELEINMQR